VARLGSAQSIDGVDAAKMAEATASSKEGLKRLSPVLALAADTAGDSYRVVHCQMMGQIGILLLVKARHFDRVDEVEFGYEATGGPTRTFPNKGGCVISMRIYGTRLVFVGTHLAAHLKYVDNRDLDVAEIIDQVRLGPRPDVDLDAQFDHAFWMGDLNYRTDIRAHEPDAWKGKPHEELFEHVKSMVASKKFADIQRYDQLRDHQEKGKVFAQFHEGKYDFEPTFKIFQKEGHTYEEKKKRIPSYTDRVLVRSIPRLRPHITIGKVQSYPQIWTSDHKPVSTDFVVSCRRPAKLAPESRPEEECPVLRFHDLQARSLVESDLTG